MDYLPSWLSSSHCCKSRAWPATNCIRSCFVISYPLNKILLERWGWDCFNSRADQPSNNHLFVLCFPGYFVQGNIYTGIQPRFKWKHINPVTAIKYAENNDNRYVQAVLSLTNCPTILIIEFDACVGIYCWTFNSFLKLHSSSNYNQVRFTPVTITDQLPPICF